MRFGIGADRCLTNRILVSWSLRFVATIFAVMVTAQRLPAPIIEPEETPTPVPSIQATTPSPAPAPARPPQSSGIETPSQRKSLPPAKRKMPESPVASVAAKTNNAPSQPLTPPAGDWQRYVVAQPDVVYPAVVKRTGMQGRGVFQLAIDPKDGTVTEVKVLTHTGYKELDAIYVMNFFQWKFQPGTITSARIPRGVSITGRANIYHGRR
jgi:outer membrane biosynthesis protein TonB